MDIQWRIQNYPDGGRQRLNLGQKPIIWQDFCRKLHENERNWTERGGGMSLPPFESTNVISLSLTP